MSFAAWQKEIDLRLAQSFTDFINGAMAEVFDWVPGELNRIAEAANAFSPQGAETSPPFKPKYAPVHENGLRDFALIGLSTARNIGDYSRADFGRMVLNTTLSHIRLVTYLSVGPDGAVEQVTIPYLTSLKRCVAYVVGMMMMDKHGLRSGIKVCGLYDEDQRGPRMPERHFFVDVPHTKRQFCCPRHENTYNQRQRRAEEKKALARSRRVQK